MGYLNYKKIKKNVIGDTKRLLADQDLKLNPTHISPFIMGGFLDKSLYETCIKQYLLLRIGAHNLNEALLSNASKKDKKLVYHMPKEWRSLLEENGISVGHARSEFWWRLYLLALIGYSCLTMLTILGRGIFAAVKPIEQMSPYVYFSNLTDGNIPKSSKDNVSYDVIRWYIEKRGRKAGFSSVKHDVINANPLKFDDVCIQHSKSGPIPDLVGWRNIVIFFVWGVAAIQLSIFDVIRGRWWHSLILNQSILSKQVVLTDPSRLAKEYLFHNSSQTYRPLWTYGAEKLGSEIVLYFYSTNIEGFKTEDGYKSATYAWRCMTWPRYLVWDKPQADFLRRACWSKSVIEIVGSIWFSDTGEFSIPKSEDTIAVFGVTPHRISRRCIYGDDDEYYSPNNCIAFLDQVFVAAGSANYNCFFKMKRNPGAFIDKNYARFIEKRSKNSSIINLNPEVAAHRVIKASSIVISMPFTATAHIARELGKPSCFYDATGLLHADDRAAHGIPIINNQKALLEWIKSRNLDI